MTLLCACIMTAGAAGCGGGGPREPDEYTGCGSDESWRTFDDQEPLVMMTADVEAMAPSVTMPAAGATVPASPKPKLTWQQDMTNVGAPTGDIDLGCPQNNPGGLTTLHLPPISGDLYDLQFSVGGSVVHRVVTSLQEWSPLDGDLGKFRGQSVSLRIWRMEVLRNDVKQGPYVARQPFLFSVGS